MVSVTFQRSNEAMVDLCKAFGLDSMKTSRIIIDMQCDDVTRVYSNQTATKEEMDALCNFCKDVKFKV